MLNDPRDELPVCCSLGSLDFGVRSDGDRCLGLLDALDRARATRFGGGSAKGLPSSTTQGEFELKASPSLL